MPYSIHHNNRKTVNFVVHPSYDRKIYMNFIPVSKRVSKYEQENCGVLYEKEVWTYDWKYCLAGYLGLKLDCSVAKRCLIKSS